MFFKNSEALIPIKKIIDEAYQAMNDETRTIESTDIPEVLYAALGAGAGFATTFTALYTLGTVGLSAVGISTALATAGGIVGGGMAAGVGVLALPVALLGYGGIKYNKFIKKKKLVEEKKELYAECIKVKVLLENYMTQNSQKESSEDRVNYLNSLSIYLERAINDLKQDLNF